MDCRRSTHVHLLRLLQAGSAHGGEWGGGEDCKGEGEQRLNLPLKPQHVNATSFSRQQHMNISLLPPPQPALQQEEASVANAQQTLERLNFKLQLQHGRPPVWEGGRIGWCCAQNQTAFRFK